MRQGKIAMIVNVSNCASVFDETIHVLKFSALASKVYRNNNFIIADNFCGVPNIVIFVVTI